MIHIILVDYTFISFYDQCCFFVSHCHVFLFSIFYISCAYQQQLLFKLTSQCQKCSKISKTNTRNTIAWVQQANHSATEPLASTTTTLQPFNGPFSGTTQVSRYQKGKTNLDFTEARDSEWQWHQLDHMQVCTSLQTVNHANTPSLSLLQARCCSCCPANSIKALILLQFIFFGVAYLQLYFRSCTSRNKCMQQSAKWTERDYWFQWVPT